MKETATKKSLTSEKLHIYQVHKVTEKRDILAFVKLQKSEIHKVTGKSKTIFHQKEFLNLQVPKVTLERNRHKENNGF